MVEPCVRPSFEPWETPVERLRPPVSFSLEPLRFLPLQAPRASLGSSDPRSPLPSSWTHSSSARSSCLPLRCFSVAGTGGLVAVYRADRRGLERHVAPSRRDRLMAQATTETEFE